MNSIALLSTMDSFVLTGICTALGVLIVFLVIWRHPELLNSKTMVRKNLGGSYDTESMEKLLSDEYGEEAGSKPEENDK